ncbi:MAG: hypothetical protein E7265_08105 [Lachnospiraceae bacterium]|nr:hypothetical protein [Lachnospiraceae bacterium]
MKKLKEKISIYVVKAPARAILIAILFLNIVLFFAAAAIISAFSPDLRGPEGYWESIFYTISMILDAGCIQYVVEDIGQAGVALIVICTVTVLLGMITFTGAVIGYITNYISNFIDNANFGKNAINVSDHIIIINWNSRASEIVNDLVYSNKKEVVIVLISEDCEGVKLEISERISATVKKERKRLEQMCEGRNFLYRFFYIRKHRLRNKLSVIVKEGDVYSTKHLADISISQARTVIILGKDIQNNTCRFDYKEKLEQRESGNTDTIKSLIQVSEFTSSEESADDQIIVVEIEDDWTAQLVEKIIAHKEKSGKCNIIPVPVNRILGQVLSQFSIMPELNKVYSELFSHKGAEFYCDNRDHGVDEIEIIKDYLNNHVSAIPITTLETKTGNHMFYVAEEEKDVYRSEKVKHELLDIRVNKDYWLKRRNIIILGHNSRMSDIMEGFKTFVGEWGHKDGIDRDILNILVIDDEESLVKQDYYRGEDTFFVKDCMAASIFEWKEITQRINEFVDAHETDTSILILSDDNVLTEDIDSKALTYLIYVQDLISDKIANDENFNPGKIDVVIEILNPKNYDVVQSYSKTNVVISNRYISRMITQIGEKEALYDFYRDILTYDEEESTEYESKELYVKTAGEFLKDMPDVLECKASQLIRTIYCTTPDNNKSIMLGYVKPNGKTILFSGEQNKMNVKIEKNDKLIIFSNH